MRRGLISWSKAELPDAVFEARIAQARAAMAEAGLDALVTYTNNTRTAAVTWLTGFVPYWSEGLAVLRRTGGPVLVVALSNRVRGWIQSVSRVDDVLPSPRIGQKAGELIASTKADGAVGVVDLGALRAAVAADLGKGGPSLRITDATALFERLRAKADPAEVALATKAGEIAHRALATVPARPDNLGTALACAEAHARSLGAEEIYLAAAPDLARDQRLLRIETPVPLGRSFALRATVAYKGVWVRVTRTFADSAAVQAATERFAAAVAGLPGEQGFAGCPSWLVEGCRVAQPLEPLMGSRVSDPVKLSAGALVSIQAKMDIDGTPVLLGAPALLGGAGQAAAPLVHPVF
jgi:Creatinase/Prolidase N-terminal domain